MIRLYNNDYEGLVHYFEDKWINRSITGNFLLESHGLENLHSGVSLTFGDISPVEQEIQIADMGQGSIEISPVSLIIQKQTQLATLFISRRKYKSRLNIVNRLEKTFFGNIFGKPAKFRRCAFVTFPYCYECKDLIEVTEEIDLESFSQDFRKLDEWVLSKVKEVCEKEISTMYSGSVWIENERIYKSCVKINPENKTFSIELK